MSEEFDKDKKENEAPEANEPIYKTVMDMKSRSRAWSVAALAVAIISVVCCCFGGWASIVLGVVAIVFAMLSRLNIGYFDNLSIAALIVAIFGIVFGIATIIMVNAIENSPEFQQLLEQYQNQNGTGGGVV